MKSDEFLRQQIIHLPTGCFRRVSSWCAPQGEIRRGHRARLTEVLGGRGCSGACSVLGAAPRTWPWRRSFSCAGSEAKFRSADAVDGWLARTAQNLARKQAAALVRGRPASREQTTHLLPRRLATRP